MRQDIIRLIEQEKAVSNIIVLTHNIDFLFVQSIVLQALRKCGHPSLTIFADAQCASEIYQHQHLVLSQLGQRFRVVPVAMQPGFRFHPKAILLSGQEKGILLIGSGNLTFGGWRQNAEIWCRYDTDRDGTAPFAAFKDYLSSVLSLVSLQDTLAMEIEECFDGRTKPWALEMEAPGRLLGKAGPASALLDQIHDTVDKDRSVVGLFVCAPYFDDEGEALTTLATRFETEVKVAVQSKRSGLRKGVADVLDERFDLTAVDFHHKVLEGGVREAFIHAKWYALDQGDEVTVILGSANCSKAALLVPGKPGNAELMTVVKLPKDQFAALFLEELEFLQIKPELKAVAEGEEEPPPAVTAFLRVMAARLDQGALQIAFNSSAEVNITEVVVSVLEAGEKSVNFQMVEPHVLLATGVDVKCYQVMLKGNSPEGVAVSDLMWVDNEQCLATTAHGRSVSDTIRKKVQSNDWNIGGWVEIAKVFLSNLEYMPVRPSVPRTETNGRGTGLSAGVYTAEDVFGETYRHPSLANQLPALLQWDERITSLRQLMLRWFGYHTEEPQGPATEQTPAGGMAPPVEPHPPSSDPPEPPPPSDPPEHPVTQSDRIRALQMVGLVAERMTSLEYLSQRQPEALSVDIQLASILLREGLHQSWITEEEYFNASHQIWSALFFGCPMDRTSGLLEYRYRTEADPDDFLARMVSPKLTAALAAWAFALPETGASLEHIRFRLSQVLSVARLPWLWELPAKDEVAQELQNLLALTTSSPGETFWEDIDRRLRSLLQRGHALRMVEEALRSKNPAMIKDSIGQEKVAQGELLWQGTMGFCIASNDFTRSGLGVNANILYLNQPGAGSIRADYAIPLKGILWSSWISLPEKAANVLDEIAKPT